MARASRFHHAFFRATAKRLFLDATHAPREPRDVDMGVLILIAGIFAVMALVIRAIDASDAALMKDAEAETVVRKKAEWAQAEKEEQEFLDSATLMSATVLSASQSGRVNLRPNVELKLRVDHPDGPYEVEVTQTIDPMKAHRFAEGCTVEVFVDPENRERVKLCRA
jgi:hypothetical protein